MPFTLSHPAAVLPLRTRGLHFPALVIGSMVPDAGYYAPLSSYFRADNHTLPHLFTFCLPMGVLLLLAAAALRPAFLATLPEPHRSALSAAPPLLPRRSFLLVLPSILIGATTHVLLDQVMHLAPSYYGYYASEIVASIAGLAALVWSHRRWLRRQALPPMPRDWPRLVLWCAVPVCALLATRWFGFRLYGYDSYRHLRLSTHDSLATLACAVLATSLAIVCTSAIVLLAKRSRTSRTPRRVSCGGRGRA